MATGDLSNNVRKLKRKLRAIRYTDEVDVTQLADGLPSVYLPVYHYAFTSYSAGLAAIILNKDIELYGKSDTRFMEAIYKILRDIFTYKPPITKEQFFSRSFAERKVIMCCDILQLVKDKAAELNQAPAKTALKTSVRPKSAEPKSSAAEPEAVSKTKRVSSSRLAPRPEYLPRRSLSPRQPPQVVNELTSTQTGQPVRHVATHSQPHRNMAGVVSSTSVPGHHSNLARHSTGTTQPPVRHVAMRSPPDDIRYKSDDTSPEHMRPIHLCDNTPSISRFCQNSVEVVSMPRCNFGKSATLTEEDIVEMNAPTSESVPLGPVAHAHNGEYESNISKTLNALTSQVIEFDSALRSMQDMYRGSLADGDPYIKGLECRIQSQIDNLMARMVLLENRVTIIETKVEISNTSTSTCQSEVSGPPCKVSMPTNQVMPISMATDHNLPIPVVASHSFPTTIAINPSVDILPERAKESEMKEDSSFAQQLKSLSSAGKRMQCLLSEAHDFSLNYSPIKTTGNRVGGQMMSAMEDTFAADVETEDDAHRSSTPTMATMGETFMNESTIDCNFEDGETQDRVSRIKSMMRETKGLLHENMGDMKTGTSSGS